MTRLEMATQRVFAALDKWRHRDLRLAQAQLLDQAGIIADLEAKLVEEMLRGRRLRDLTLRDYEDLCDAFDAPDMLVLSFPALAESKDDIQWCDEATHESEVLEWLLEHGYLVAAEVR